MKIVEEMVNPDGSVLVHDAITKAVLMHSENYLVDEMGTCLNLAPVIMKYAEILACGVWLDKAHIE